MRKVVVALALVLSALPAFAQGGNAGSSLHECARRFDTACVTKALDAGTEIDVPDAQGKTALLGAVEALLLNKGNVPKAALDTVNLLFQRGANEDVLAVQAFLAQQGEHPAAAPLLALFSNAAAVSQWRRARDDARVRAELDLSPEQYQKVRANVEALRGSGRFIDLYVAYGVSRNVDDIKRAQSLAAERDEFQALEHMAVMTVPDPTEVVEPTISVQRDTLRQFPVGGKAFSLLSELSPEHDLALLIKLRQTPDSRIHLRFASYLATVHVVLAVYRRSADGIDPVAVLPAILPVSIRLVPVNYVGAGILRLSDFKEAIAAKVAALGGDLAFSRAVQMRLIRLERVE